MKKRLALLLPGLLAALVWLGGCMRDDNQPMASELDEPNYRLGQQLGKQGRYREALTAFLKVIAKRNEDAPESHLEAGLIYSQQLKEPIAAIYHFLKYLELQPNSRQAPLVRQRIDAAKRDFARTLPAQPLESAADRLAMQDQLAQLQKENDQLKAELLAFHEGAPAAVPRSRLGAPPSGDDSASVHPPVINTEPAEESPLSLAPAPTPVTVIAARPAITPPPAITKAGASRSTAAKPATKPAATGRKHTVQVGDTLYKIAQRYYGAGGASAKAQAIYEANRDVMKSLGDLKPGMELKLP